MLSCRKTNKLTLKAGSLLAHLSQAGKWNPSPFQGETDKIQESLIGLYVKILPLPCKTIEILNTNCIK